MDKYQISAKDREILRQLAGKVAEYAAHPREDKKKKLWTLHNDLKTSEPVVFIDPEGGWREIFPPESLTCEGEIAREWEEDLRRRIYHVEMLKDDFVVDSVFSVPCVYEEDGWGLDIIHEGVRVGGAYHVKPAIEDYEEDFEKLHFPNLIVDYIASDRLLALAQETFGDILHVERYGMWWWSLGLTRWFIDLRGLEDFLCDFIAEPEWFHRMMDFLCTGALKRIDELEEKNLLFSNTGNHYVGSGGFGFTTELPPPNGPAPARSVWGFVESQETSTVSHDMYGEFVFPYHKRILERFGMNCFGCCEPFEGRWKYVKQLPRLRRISCSPWSDRALAADLLRDQYILSHKLSPTPLATPEMNEAEVRRNLRAVLDHAEGTIPELIMKDNHTLGKNPMNAVRWVELAREEIANT